MRPPRPEDYATDEEYLEAMDAYEEYLEAMDAYEAALYWEEEMAIERYYDKQSNS